MKQRGGASDKRTQFWSSIEKEKLDSLKWVMLHSGISVATLQNEDGRTGLQIAAMRGKHKALLLMCDILRQKREIKESIDVRDDDGRTPLLLAVMNGHAQCVDHLLYYGADKNVKSAEGLTAKDYAMRAKRADIVELLEDDAPAGDAAGDAEAVDEDGLTSTQRSKLKKKQLREAERRGMVAAVTAAAAVEDDEDVDEDADRAVPAAAAAAAATAPGVSVASASATASAAGLPPLAPLGKPVWAEVKSALEEKRRELNVHRARTAAPAGGEDVPADAGSIGGEALPDGQVIDPALWHCSLLNRLELHVTGLEALPPHVAHLSALQTLIVSGNGFASLPDELGLLAELKFLDVSKNRLTQLPASLGRLKKLEVLDAANNALVSIAALSEMTSLTALMLDHNELEALTLNLPGLARLATLTASHNKLTALPEDWEGMTSLATLSLGDNAIEELPAGLADLPEKKLRDVRLLPNPIADKKVLKILNSDRPEKVIKELFKHLQTSGGGGKGKKGKGKH